MSRSGLILLLCLPVLALGAEPSGNEILSKVDDGLNAFTDGIWESKLLVRQPGSSQPREYGFTTYQKVPDKRLVRFTAPGDVKGMGVLVENADTMYVYLPGFQKVRRMGTHVKNQTFMGSDFSFEDMSQIRFGATYEAKIASSDDKEYVLEMTARAGKDLEFPKLKMWVDKKYMGPTRIDYMDPSGKVQKTQMRDGYAVDARNRWTPVRIVVTDHRRNEHVSEIVFVNIKLDQGLGDEVFSVRALARGQ